MNTLSIHSDDAKDANNAEDANNAKDVNNADDSNNADNGDNAKRSLQQFYIIIIIIFYAYQLNIIRNYLL